MTRIGKACLTTMLGLALALAGLQGCGSPEERFQEHLEAARRHRIAGDRGAALIELRSALKLKPQSAATNLRIGQLLMSMGQLQNAVFYLKEAVRLAPEDSEAALLLADLLRFDNPQLSRKLLNDLLAREPANPRVRIGLAELALAGNDTDTALREVLTAVELAPELPSVYWELGYVQQARIREQQLRGETPEPGLFASTLEAYDRFIELSGEHEAIDELRWNPRLQRARVLAAWPGHEEEAAREFRAALETATIGDRPAKRREAVSFALQFATRVGDEELRRLALEQRLEFEPDDRVARATLADLVAEQEGSAEEVFAEILERDHEDADPHVEYARHLARTGEIDRAVEYLRKRADEGIDPPEVLGAIADLQYAYRRFDDASRTVRRMEREHPDHWRTGLALAQRAMEEARPADAVVILQGVREERENALVYRLLAGAEHRLGNHRAALEAIERSIELTPGRAPGTQRLRARILHDLGNFEASRREFELLRRQGVALSDRERVMLARSYYETGQPRRGQRLLALLAGRKNASMRAVLEFEERERSNPDPAVRARVRAALDAAFERRPHNAALVNRLTWLDLEEGRPENALQRLDLLLRSNDVRPEFWLMRAKVRLTQGDFDGALEDAEHAMEMRPTLREGPEVLASIHRAKGEANESVRALEDAAGKGLLSPSEQVVLGRLYLQAGDEVRARQTFEKALAGGVQQPGLKNDLAFLLAKSGEDLDRALRLAEEAQRDLSETPQVADTLGYVYLRKGLARPALVQFEYANSLAERQNQPKPEFRYHMGLALRSLGRIDEAAAAFEQASALDPGFEEALAARRELEPLLSEVSPTDDQS